MEQNQLDREAFSCSICLDLLKDPVTIPCGHSYCRNCIKTHWDVEDQKRIHSCPQCRETFIPRPVLKKNTMLAALVDQLEKTGLQAAADDHLYAGPEVVTSDSCTGRNPEPELEPRSRAGFSAPSEPTDSSSLDILPPCFKKPEPKSRTGFSAPSEPTDSSSLDILPPCFKEPEPKSRTGFSAPSEPTDSSSLDILPPCFKELEPKSRIEFLKYSCEITLDPNTAHNEMFLLEGNRKVTRVRSQSYPSHPDRFIHCHQVLSRESLTGRCYWEVEWSGIVHIAVTYKNIYREGRWRYSGFGRTDKSWSLVCTPDGYQFHYNTNDRTPVPGPRSSRVGVYLDHRAGILSFYSVSESMTLLHRVQTTFTQPLLAGIRLQLDSSAKICK